MNSSAIVPHRYTQSGSRVKRPEKTLKLVVFNLGSLNFAFRIESVYKVVNQTPIYSNGSTELGIAHVGEFEITVVDFQKRLTQALEGDRPTDQTYLMIVQSAEEELIGIPVSDAPVLMEVPLTQIRTLPESYRRADRLNISSHVAVLPNDPVPITIFIVDAEKLLPALTAPAQPLLLTEETFAESA